jgi:hypothetical protein
VRNLSPSFSVVISTFHATASRRISHHLPSDAPPLVYVMVYRGKLSKACLPCRRRKLVCDLKAQGCSQCRRAKLVCHGYRDTETLRVTDETSAVQRRVEGAQPRSTSRSKPKTLTSRSRSELYASIICQAAAIPQSVVVPTRTRAKDLFYYNYVIGNLKPFDFLQPFCSPTSRDDHLTTSMDAVALAYLDYQRHAPDAQIEARQCYIAALRHMNRAIQDPELAKKDSTILAILLLDLYEKITNKEPRYEGAWAAHLQGALTLVKMRGNQQFDDPTVRSMLLRVSTNEMISCIVNHRPVPAEVMTLRANIASYITPSEDPKSKESDLMIEFAGLMHEIEEGNLRGDEAICSLKDLDDRFLTLSMDIQRASRFNTVQVTEKSSHHWESHHHVYPCDQIGHMWNVLRVTRILSNELILARCSDIEEVRSPNSKYHSTRQLATEILESMISDICATVPQYIGHIPAAGLYEAAETQPTKPSPLTGVLTSKKRLVAAKLTSGSNLAHYLPCYRLIFPLYIAAQSSAAPRGLRSWAIDQLLFMKDYHAIKNAAQVAEILKSGENKDPWLVYAMLGSYAFIC